MSLAAALVLPFALMQAATPPAPAPPDPSDVRMARCVASIDADAAKAYEDAMAWAGETREANAYRCAAMALSAQGRNEEAAARFESIAAQAPTTSMRAELYGQAGNAYLLARSGSRALNAFNQSVTLLQNEPELLPDALIDRSMAYAMQRDWRHAEEDLSRVIDRRPNDAAALSLRASARMQQRAFDLAERDALAAVAADPRSVDAHLVLGHIREAKRTGEIPQTD